jgi:RNA polymerase sigma-70 factor (ECF subfamily)
MSRPQIDESLIGRLYRRAGAGRWTLQPEAWAETLKVSAGRAFEGKSPGAGEIARYLESLHLEDLAIACACAAGVEAAWDHFVREVRPVLYRAADAIDPSGGAREIADSLYAELFGLEERDGARRSLFRYFHGRSSLATWLRAVLAQRHVDRIRAGRRLDPLPDEESALPSANTSEPDADRERLAARMTRALAQALAALDPRDRLRLGFYYAQDMTLADIGRVLREHEATVSRHLTRTRRTIRAEVERHLRAVEKLDEAGIAACFEAAIEESGNLDLDRMLAQGEDRKKPATGRSREVKGSVAR